jgi:hypothetical protein|nr:MAG TPA: hypothetical protein [Caudoviricetes sp.]
MQDTKTIQLPSGGEAVLRTRVTNRMRLAFVKVKGNEEAAIDLGIKTILINYKGAEGSEASFEALMESDSFEDFQLISKEIQGVLDPSDSPKG